jgi:hypothetical protein
LLLSPIGDSVQKFEDFIRGDLINLPVTTLHAKFGKDKFISSGGIFFWNGSGGRSDKFLRLLRFS